MPPSDHGTMGRYNNADRCRCALCRAAKAAYMQAYRRGSVRRPPRCLRCRVPVDLEGSDWAVTGPTRTPLVFCRRCGEGICGHHPT
jgi:hypothetical protein